MKTRLSLLLLSLLCMLSSAVYAQQALYVYQKDGKIDAFMTYEVDSIVYSQVDLDGIAHDSYQVQEIWTSDSTYRFAIEEIDSISYITPETVYQPGVVQLAGSHMDYIIRCDSLTIFYRDDTPAKILPAVGAKLVFAEMNDIFPAGFAGEVIGVTFINNEYAVECTDVSLTEVFEIYYSVGSVYGYVDTLNQPQAMPAYDKKGDTSFTLQPYVWDICDELGVKVNKDDNLAINFEREMSVTFIPTFHIKTLLIINSNEGIYFDYNIIGDFKVEERLSFSGGIAYSKDLPLVTFEKPIVPYVNFYIQPGLSIGAKIKASFEAYATQNFRLTLSDDISTTGKDVLKPYNNLRLTGHSFEAQGCAEGEITLGAYIKLGFKINDKKSDKELLDIYAQGTLGHQLIGGAVVYNNELDDAYKTTQLYEKLRASKLEYNTFGNITLNASLFEDIISYSYSLPFHFTKNIKTWNLAPSFRDVSFTDLGYLSDAKCTIEGLCLFPVECGYSVRNESNEEVDKTKYGIYFKEGSMPMDRIFDPYPVGSKYTLYPTIKWLGFEMLASPSAPLKEKEWVRIKSFEVTDTIYDEKQELEYQGEHYFYKHQCEVLVKLEDTTGVEDWGYVYVDPRGDSTFISLMSFGDVYRDNRYAYYRNNAEDSVCLIGYATFRDGEQYIGEKRVFDLVYNHYCTDENHHHGVDLGLSSNILWACCNLGATKPEEYGDYYAFAETATKNSYSEANHWYYHQDPYDPYGQYAYYETPPGGVDISGTASDVVTHHWEDGWRMPTEKELQELVDSCTWTWTTKNGIIGYQVTGPNGNSIFLPAAGAKITSNNKGKEDYAGVPNKLTWYRSSRISKPGYYNKWEYSYGLRFKQDLYDLNDGCLRFPGYVIRPVMNKKTTE